MSAFSSPASLLTVHANSTPIQIMSLLKIGSGIAAFLAPAVFASRAFGFSAHKNSSGASVGISVGNNTTRAGSESEQSIAVRLFASRNLAFGLLLRDSTAAIVARTLQIGVIVDALDLLACVVGFVEGNLSTEVATAVATVTGLSAAFQLYILNR